MKNKITVLEQVKISDKPEKIGPKGVIKIFDKEGNLVLQTENLITEVGREFILKSLLKNVGLNSDSSTLDRRLLLGVGNANSQGTDPSDESIAQVFGSTLGYNSLDANGGLFEVTADDSSDQTTGAELTINNDLSIMISITLSSSLLDNNAPEIFNLQHIGLCLTTDSGTPTDGNTIVFSHAAFNPVPIDSNSTQTINYYIYF